MVNQTTKRILIPTVWATGWAASNLKYGYDKLMDDAKSIFRIFPVENQN